MISIRLDVEIYDLLKQKNINISGLAENLFKEWLQKQENNNPIAQQTQEYNERLTKCVNEFIYDNFYAIRSKYAEKIVRQALQKQGYTDEEIQRAYEIAKQEYENRHIDVVPSNITILKGTPTDWQDGNANDNNKNTNDVDNTD